MQMWMMLESRGKAVRVWTRISYLEGEHYKFGARWRPGDVAFEAGGWYKTIGAIPQEIRGDGFKIGCRKTVAGFGCVA